MISRRDRDAAMEYLRGGNRVAVLPSRMDNLPYTVLECLGSGIPFVASAIGGIPEMVRPRDHKRVLFELTAPALADRLVDVMRRGLPAVAMRVPQAQTAAVKIEQVLKQFNPQEPAASVAGLLEARKDFAHVDNLRARKRAVCDSIR